jgi:hypothetical protein
MHHFLRSKCPRKKGKHYTGTKSALVVDFTAKNSRSDNTQHEQDLCGHHK